MSPLSRWPVKYSQKYYVDYSKPANRQTDKKNPGIYYSRISGLTHNLVIERPAAVWLYSAAGIFY